MALTTRVVHAGKAADPATGAHGTPIYHNTSVALGTFVRFKAFWAVDERVYSYRRDLNPTGRHLGLKMRDFEGTEESLSLLSEMAAVSGAMRTLGAGGYVIAATEIYSTSFKHRAPSKPRLLIGMDLLC